MSYTIAVIGATGNVGQEVLNNLVERGFPYKQVHAVASNRSVGQPVSFGEQETLRVQGLEDFDFSKIDLAFFCAGSDVSKVYAPKAAKQGAIVIDKASYFRLDPGVPLVIPEVNGDALKFEKGQIITSPNCVALPLVMVLKPLMDKVPIKRVVLSTYQSVSGMGKAAMDELYNQCKGIYVNDIPTPQVFPKPIAFNVIPLVGHFEASGHTDEETKVMMETRKILGNSFKLAVTCVRVPVFVGHSLSVNIEFEKPMTPVEARRLLSEAPGLFVLDRTSQDSFLTPVEVAGEDLVAVSRIRQDQSVAHGLDLWIVSDNLRKGAALNAVQIAETLIKARS